MTQLNAAKSSCSNSIMEGMHQSCQKKTVKTMLLEDQMSTCSCSKRSLKGSEYGLKVGKNCAFSEISSIEEH